ncbi:MAG: hypothetical protein NVSMB26_05860 [Beijerinckiaceae bacterium]
MKIDPPWTGEELQVISDVFEHPDYAKRRSVQILDALEPFIVARIEAAQKNASWQPIETAPKDGTRVVCAEYSGGDGDPESGHWRFWTAAWRRYASREAGFGLLGKPSAWLHLPPPELRNTQE